VSEEALLDIDGDAGIEAAAFAFQQVQPVGSLACRAAGHRILFFLRS
jgi:hypothetical protein